MKFKIFSRSRDSSSRSNTPKLIEYNYINSIKKEILEGSGLIGKGVLSEFEVNKDFFDYNSDDSDSSSSYSKTEPELKCEIKEFGRHFTDLDLEIYYRRVHERSGCDGHLEETFVEVKDNDWMNSSSNIRESICYEFDDDTNIMIRRKENYETASRIERTEGQMENIDDTREQISSCRGVNGGSEEVDEICLDSIIENDSEYSFKKGPDFSEANTVMLEEENEINKLRDSIFRKLDILEQKLQSIKQYGCTGNEGEVSGTVAIKNSNKIQIKVEDLLNHIGRNFLSGINHLIENGHGRLINVLNNNKRRITTRDIRNIIGEYSEIELENILALNNDNEAYSNISNLLEYPIRGVGYWQDQGLCDSFNDRWFISKLTSGSFFGIVDSYNGDYVANEVEKLIVGEFDRLLDSERDVDNNKMANIFLKTIVNIDHKIIHSSPKNSLNTGSGLMSCFVFHSKSSSNHILFTCNLGNCKGFLSRRNCILKFNGNKDNDHCRNKDVDFDHYYTVENGLGFGLFKPPVKSYYEINNTPYVVSVELSLNSDKYIFIASDSIWKVLSEEDVNELISCIIDELYTNFPNLNKNVISKIVSHSVVTESLLRGVTDNLVCMTVLF